MMNILYMYYEMIIIGQIIILYTLDLYIALCYISVKLEEKKILKNQNDLLWSFSFCYLSLNIILLTFMDR